MKKFVIGLLIGLLIATVSPAYGAVSSLVGKKISKEVKVVMQGEALEKKAILLDGVTYVPLRVVTERLGLQAEYVNGEVVVRNKADELNAIEQKIKKKKLDVDGANQKITYNDEQILLYEKLISDNPGKTDWLIDPNKVLEGKKGNVPVLKAELTKLLSELATLEAQKDQLEAQQ